VNARYATYELSDVSHLDSAATKVSGSELALPYCTLVAAHANSLVNCQPHMPIAAICNSATTKWV
jgi:hypothetical protein